MDIRSALKLVESLLPRQQDVLNQHLAQQTGQRGSLVDPADRFIHAATEAIKTTFGGDEQNVLVRFAKINPERVAVTDDMHIVRTKRSWAVLRVLTDLARRYGVAMNIQGAAGRKFR